jgi:hypothetical protein
MKITQTQFNKAQENFSNVSLSGAQKQKILGNIYRAHPIPTPSPYQFFLHHRVLVASLVVVLFVSGGTSYASAHSLPGEPLYPFKVKVLEPAIAALQITDMARQKYNLLLLQKRVVEIIRLEEQSAVTPHAQGQSLEATQKNIQSLKKESNEEDTQEISVSVSQYVDVFNKVSLPENQIEYVVEDTLDSELLDDVLPLRAESLQEKGLIKAEVIGDLGVTVSSPTSTQVQADEADLSLPLSDSSKENETLIVVPDVVPGVQEPDNKVDGVPPSL